MYFITCLTAILSFVQSTKIEDIDHHTLLDLNKIVKEVNALKTTWTAKINTRFENMTIAQVKKQLGTILPGEEGYIAPELERVHFTEEELPISFDARVGFPQCTDIIGHVRDQSNCGSCWAFSAVEALNDRHCIVHGEHHLISPEDTVSCCTGSVCSFSMGCNGGQPAGAWNWFVKQGVSTGGDWEDNGKGTTCKPYSMQSCAHHVEPPSGMPACDDIESYKTPTCTSSCSEQSYTHTYTEDKHFAKTSYSIKGIENIQREIFEKGSISVAMSVYEDFESYSSGVYRHVTGKYLGGHAIKMIGWGTDNDIPFWICVNSWNDSWGEHGTFRILRGFDECGIESSCVAGDV